MRVVLLRHGHAANPPGVGDGDRPLAARGILDSAAAGEWLRSMGWGASRIVSSNAERARQTANLAAAKHPVEVDPRLYLAEVPTIEAVIDDHKSDTVWIVGHNPGLSELAHEWSKGSAPELKTACAACFRDGEYVMSYFPGRE